MARLVFADSTSAYDGRDLERRPLGGTEASVIRLARELASRGHAVAVHTKIGTEVTDEGVCWRPLSTHPDGADAFIAIQQPALLDLAPAASRRAIWVLWGANQLRHFRQFWRMWRHRPIPILMSQAQVRDYWPTLPRRGSLALIPLPTPPDVRALAPLSEPPAPRAIFASNPQRNLLPLVEIWASAILPRAPNATLDVYGVHNLGANDDAWTAWAGALLPAGMPDAVKTSVRVHPTAPRPDLLAAMRDARCMLYLSHKCEAFCLSLAEAQALGTPAVIAPVAAAAERVIDGVTGFHRADPVAFADAAVRLLTDDDLWRRQHTAALQRQQGLTCAEYAERFERALLGEAAGREDLGVAA